jgi:hypothetical protein
MSKPRRICKTAISQEIFVDTLLPDGTTILQASYDPVYGRVELILEHKDLPDVSEGYEIPSNNILFTRVPCECGGNKIVISWSEKRRDLNDEED